MPHSLSTCCVSPALRATVQACVHRPSKAASAWSAPEPAAQVIYADGGRLALNYVVPVVGDPPA